MILLNGRAATPPGTEFKYQSSYQVCNKLLFLFYLPYKALYGFPGGSDSKESACNVGDWGLIPGLGRFPWRRAWQPTPVFLPGESPWTEDPGRLQFMGLQRVGHD